ncbi:MAG: ExbD/TolR family protein [Pirellulales bacterium]
MRFRHTGMPPEEIHLQMTPMIDIVFQLLVFFIMTFKIVLPEGDFNIKMPLAAPREGIPDDFELPPLQLRMASDDGGELAALRLNDQPLAGFGVLHLQIINLVGGDRGPGDVAASAEVELDCDYDLKYKYVIDAITAISGYVTPENHVVKLIEKIKFAPPRKAP